MLFLYRSISETILLILWYYSCGDHINGSIYNDRTFRSQRLISGSGERIASTSEEVHIIPQPSIFFLERSEAL